MLESFLKYQKLIQTEFANMQQRYGFEVINGNRLPRAIALDLQARVARIIGGIPIDQPPKAAKSKSENEIIARAQPSQAARAHVSPETLEEVTI